MKVPVKEYFYRHWLKKRHEQNPIELTLNNIYILPSKLGTLFLTLTLVLFIVGVNYQNNLMLLASYFFVVVQLLAFVAGFRNLYKLRLEVIDVKAVFSPDRPRVRFKIASVKPFTVLNIAIDRQVEDNSFKDTLHQGCLELPFSVRGCYSFPKVSIYSTYPYGLVKTFSYWQPSLKIFVYPALGSCARRDIESKNTSDDLEYQGIRGFNPADNPVRISWKHFARTGELQIKQFDRQSVPTSQPEVYLNYLEEVGDKEQRLSALSTKLKDALDANHHVVMRLPDRNDIRCVDDQTFRKAWESLSEF